MISHSITNLIYPQINLFSNVAENFFNENSYLENLQVFVLFIAFLLFLITFFLNRRPDRAIIAFLAAICYTGMLREVDFEHFNIHPFLIFMLADGGRYTTVALGLIIPLAYAAFHFKKYFKATIKFLINPEGIFLFIAALLLGVAAIFEHKHTLNAEAWEELSEFCAYIFLFASSVVVLRSKSENKEEDKLKNQ